MKFTIHKLLTAIALTAAAQWPAAAIAAAGAAPSTVALDHCSWDHPGVNPFMGDVVAAVDRYRDIAPDVRERLKARMARREYDDLVSIRRDSIQGRGGYDYGNTISDMHFGTHQVCRSVTRAAWSPTMEERGLVYCESGTCILVPTVCRNVSRVTRRGVGNELADGPLVFDPPGAGPQAPAASDVPPIEWAGPTGAGVPAIGSTAVGRSVRAAASSAVAGRAPCPWVASAAIPAVWFPPRCPPPAPAARRRVARTPPPRPSPSRRPGR